MNCARRASLLLPVLATLGASCGDRTLTTIRLAGGAPADGQAPPGDCSVALIGFATGTVGGQGGQDVTVRTPDDLVANAKSMEPLIIYIQGMIPLTGGAIEVKSRKTIIGVGPDSGLDGGGLNLSDGSDIIIRNLKIIKAPVDAIGLQRSTNIWIDHCDLSSDMEHDKEFYDGLIDMTHGSENVTVSWTWFHDHFHVSLIGDGDDTTDDTGHLNVTFHHNWFERTYSYNPSIRFGTLHAFNNYYVNVGFSGITSRMGAKVLAEFNYFDTVATPPLTTVSDSPMDGSINEKMINTNVFSNSGMNNITQTTDWTPTYFYTADPVLMVPDIVKKCAGTGKLP